MLGCLQPCRRRLELPFSACVDEAGVWHTAEATRPCIESLQFGNAVQLGPASNLLDQVPHQTVRDGTPVRFKVHLSKFGFLEDSQLKGPVNSFAVSLSCNHFYQLFINLFINFLSTVYQLFINFLSTLNQLFINFLSTPYQLVINFFINCLSTFYHLFSTFVNIHLLNFTY